MENLTLTSIEELEYSKWLFVVAVWFIGNDWNISTTDSPHPSKPKLSAIKNDRQAFSEVLTP